MVISNQEYSRRRQALLAKMQPGSAALIFAAPEVTRSADSEYPYRQSSDFWYFTGFNEPEAVLVLIDAGCEYQGYAGDITRTFPVSGKFTPAQRAIYDIVLESLETALTLYRPGTSIQEVTGAVVRIMITGLVRLGILKGEVDTLITENAHRPYFMHGLSHWLGLDVHDVGAYGSERSRVLEPGMVLTVEPGLYVAPDADVPQEYRGIGIRIEDDIVITETGNENLTASVVKNADDIEALMAAARV